MFEESGCTSEGPKQRSPIIFDKVHLTQHCVTPFPDSGLCCTSDSPGQYCGSESSNSHQLLTPLNTGCTRERLAFDGDSWRASCNPVAVSLYMCRGGLPAAGVSQRVSKSARSAKRIRMGYKVPDFNRFLR